MKIKLDARGSSVVLKRTEILKFPRLAAHFGLAEVLVWLSLASGWLDITLNRKLPLLASIGSFIIKKGSGSQQLQEDPATCESRVSPFQRDGRILKKI